MSPQKEISKEVLGPTGLRLLAFGQPDFSGTLAGIDVEQISRIRITDKHI